MRAWITGAGAIGPAGQGLDQLAAAAAENSGLRLCGRVERIAGLDPIESRRVDRLSRMAVVAAREAVERAGYPVRQRAGRTGVLLGTMTGGFMPSHGFLRRVLARGGPPASPAVFTNAIRNGPAAHVALDLGVHGPGFTVCLAEASGLAAFRCAAELLDEGRADAVLCGGVEETTDEIAAILEVRGYEATEGAYLTLLERPDAARERGARPLAGLLGAASVSVPCLPWEAPADAGAVDQVAAAALADAGLDREAIDLDLSHGQGGAQLLAALLVLGQDERIHHVLVRSSGWGGHYEAVIVGRVEQGQG